MATKPRRDDAQIVRGPDGQLWEMRPVGPGLAKAPACPTLRDVVGRYLEAMAPSAKPSTREARRSVLETRILPVLGGLPVDAIGRPELAALQASLLGDGYAPRTVNTTLSRLHAVLRWAADEEIGPPVRRVRPLRVEDEARTYPRAKYEALLAATCGWKRALLLLLGDAGLRLGEAAALRWTCVGDSVLCVCATRWRKHRHSPKGGRRRAVPMTRRLREALAALEHERDTVVPRKLDSAAFGRMFAGTCDRLRIPRVTAHALRHSYASQLQALGVGTATIRDLLGHGSVSTTDRYLHTEPAGLAAAVALLDGGG